MRRHVLLMASLIMWMSTLCIMTLFIIHFFMCHVLKLHRTTLAPSLSEPILGGPIIEPAAGDASPSIHHHFNHLKWTATGPICRHTLR
ncbi:hypothetical protein EDC04DRAFT_2679635 [Pisolithus marmoratus]|nr:hypothetical protein EDC04DRAFT_2679635 [Pisolithus marmoratus]